MCSAMLFVLMCLRRFLVGGDLLAFEKREGVLVVTSPRYSSCGLMKGQRALSQIPNLTPCTHYLVDTAPQAIYENPSHWTDVSREEHCNILSARVFSGDDSLSVSIFDPVDVV